MGIGGGEDPLFCKLAVTTLLLDDDDEVCCCCAAVIITALVLLWPPEELLVLLADELLTAEGETAELIAQPPPWDFADPFDVGL